MAALSVKDYRSPRIAGVEGKRSYARDPGTTGYKPVMANILLTD